MIRSIPLAVLMLAALASPAAAQDGEWRPPGARMPTMPTLAELGSDWLAPRADWFAGLQSSVGVSARDLRAVGEPRGASVARVARFLRGPLPIVIWTDRNGDQRADAVEIYRTGAIVAQLIDSDYDGAADVLRHYDASGALIREERL